MALLRRQQGGPEGSRRPWHGLRVIGEPRRPDGGGGNVPPGLRVRAKALTGRGYWLRGDIRGPTAPHPPRGSACSLAEAKPAGSPPLATNYPPRWLRARRGARQRRGPRAGGRGRSGEEEGEGGGSPGRPRLQSRGGGEIRAVGASRSKWK